MTVIDYDLCVIGGGINGAGIARDAAGRGLKVLLLEAQDLGGATSSSSTKLVHGGLRYLEYYEFKLVHDALKERETLLSIAPHVIWPMEFVLPHTPEQRPAWMIRIGLFLYDHLAKRNSLPASRGVKLRDEKEYGAPLKKDFEKGFCYADCWADDSRLVALNAMSAAQQGAKILTRHKCTKLRIQDDYWIVEYEGSAPGGEAHVVNASMVINAAGPWVRDVVDRSGLSNGDDRVPNVRLVKGSHIIVPRQFEGAHAYILQQPDQRITFAIPYEHEYTLIGTTEEEFSDDPRDPMISDAEMAYLINAHNLFFDKAISKEDILWTYSGVRPLYDEAKQDNKSATSATRDYKLHVHEGFAAPMVSVFGGKLTTYRKLAEQAVDQILDMSHRSMPAWTSGEVLPGGNIARADFSAFLEVQGQRYKWLPKALLNRYARSYGTCMDVFLQGARVLKDLGRDFGGHVFEAEILYLLRYEFAQTGEDVLWRRSKIGLHISDKSAAKIDAYIKQYWKDRA